MEQGDAISRRAVHIAINSQIFDTEYPSELDELERMINEIPSLDVAPVITGETSDGYHMFNELYHHRAVLFSVIVKAFPDRAWKSRKHHDGSMYDGMFIVGIETPDGQATYHYDIDPYWDMFKCKELEYAPEWDGHTPDEAIDRIGKLEPMRHGRWQGEGDGYADGYPVMDVWYCSECGYCIDVGTDDPSFLPKYCRECGAKMDGGNDDEIA